MMEGIERIKILASEIKDEALLAIVNYLLTRADMNEKYLNEKKSLKQMVSYIKDQAKKMAKDNMAMVKDDVVFGWAIHYWDETNSDLEIDDSSEETTEVSKPVKKIIKKPTKAVPEGQLTLFDMM